MMYTLTFCAGMIVTSIFTIAMALFAPRATKRFLFPRDYSGHIIYRQGHPSEIVK